MGYYKKHENDNLHSDIYCIKNDYDYSISIAVLSLRSGCIHLSRHGLVDTQPPLGIH